MAKKRKKGSKKAKASKSRARKPARKKTAKRKAPKKRRKPARKKSPKRKPAKKKPKRKKPTRKKPLKKKPVKKKTAKKKPVKAKPSGARKAKKKVVGKRAKPSKVKAKPRSRLAVTEAMPPPPVIYIPAPNETAVGRVTHYYSHLQVVVIQLEGGSLQIGDRIHFKGHTTDFHQIVESMEVEHQRIVRAYPGDVFGLKVIDHAREHDVIYKIQP